MTGGQGSAGAAAITIWHVDLDGFGVALDELEAREHLLSDDERQDGSPSLPADVLIRRRRARIALRFLLERQGVGNIRGAALIRNPHGKPALASGGPVFNVSHSGSSCLIAMADSGPIGVDVELPRTVQLDAARRALIVAAGAGLAGVPIQCKVATEDPAAFLIAWTRLEAIAKARGDGVGRLLTALGITAEGARTASQGEISRRAAGLIASYGLAVTSIDLPVAGAGAVAGPSGLLVTAPVCVAVARSDIAYPDCRLG